MANETTFDCTSCIHREICPAYEVTQIECKNYRPYCKDCSKWMPEFGGCKEFTTERLPTGGKKVFVTKPDDFCSYGERKEG